MDFLNKLLEIKIGWVKEIEELANTWTQQQFSDALDDITLQVRDKVEKGEIALNRNKRSNSSCNFLIKEM